MADLIDDVDRVQKLLGLTLDNTDRERVKIYIMDAQQAIMMYVSQYLPEDAEFFPSELNYLVDQLVLAKYNKFHNEGMNSISEEGLSMTFNSNDLKDYLTDLQAWIDHKTSTDDSMSGNAIGW